MPHNRCCPIKKKKKKVSENCKLYQKDNQNSAGLFTLLPFGDRQRGICCHTTRLQLHSSCCETPQFILGTPLNKKVFVILFYSVMYYNQTKLSFVSHPECKITNKLSCTFGTGLFLACWLWYFPIIHRVLKSFVFSILRCGNIFPVI